MNTISTKHFDTVIVPDFSSGQFYDFEISTLFFLASWLENAGGARNYPLHLACIGQPPVNVCELAKRCNASITVHEPVNISDKYFTTKGNVFNKFRCFDIQGKTDNLLLLDTDVLILSDISGISDLNGSIAISPANRPRVPKKYWKQIYQLIDIPLPAERIKSIENETGLKVARKKKFKNQESEAENMLPYYNSGVIYMPWACGLLDIWIGHTKMILPEFTFEKPNQFSLAIIGSDQISLPTSLEYMKTQRMKVVRLPDCFHARRQHLAGSLRFDDIKIYHSIGFYLGLKDINVNLRNHIAEFSKNKIIKERIKYGRSKMQTIFRKGFPLLNNSQKLNKMILKLYVKYIEELL